MIQDKLLHMRVVATDLSYRPQTNPMLVNTSPLQELIPQTELGELNHEELIWIWIATNEGRVVVSRLSLTLINCDVLLSWIVACCERKDIVANGIINYETTKSVWH